MVWIILQWCGTSNTELWNKLAFTNHHKAAFRGGFVVPTTDRLMDYISLWVPFGFTWMRKSPAVSPFIVFMRKPCIYGLYVVWTNCINILYIVHIFAFRFSGLKCRVLNYQHRMLQHIGFDFLIGCLGLDLRAKGLRLFGIPRKKTACTIPNWYGAGGSVSLAVCTRLLPPSMTGDHYSGQGWRS